MTTQQTERTFEDFATVDGVEYSVEVKPDDAGGYWFTITREPWTNTPASYWPMIYNAHIPDASNLLDALRAGIREPRTRMKNWVHSFALYRCSAQDELPGNVKGSKRGYYTKLANEARTIAVKYSAEWKLAKAIWKQLTKLSRV